MARTAEFSQHRSALFGLAYRMLGTALDVELDESLSTAFLLLR